MATSLSKDMSVTKFSRKLFSFSRVVGQLWKSAYLAMLKNLSKKFPDPDPAVGNLQVKPCSQIPLW